MPLSQSQMSLIEKARNVGGSDMAVPLDDAASSYLLARLAHDLDLAAQHPEVSGPVSPFFETMPVSSLRLEGIEFLPLAERLFASMPDADTYFSCLAALHHALPILRCAGRRTDNTLPGAVRRLHPSTFPVRVLRYCLRTWRSTMPCPQLPQPSTQPLQSLIHDIEKGIVKIPQFQ